MEEVLGNELNHAKTAIGIVLRPRGKEQFIAGSVRRTVVAELQSPQLIYLHGCAGGSLQLAQKRPRSSLKRIDGATGKVIGDKNRTTEWSEIGRSLRDTPRLIEGPVGSEPMRCAPKLAVEIHIAAGRIAGACVSDEYLMTDHLYSIRRKACGNRRIGEDDIGQVIEILVVNVNPIVGLVGRIEPIDVGCNRQPRIHRATR